jgi:hypothetical protein
VPPPPHIPIWAAHARARLRALPAAARGHAPSVDSSVIDLFTNDQRLDGNRIRRDLRLCPRYRSFREGLPAALATEQASLAVVDAIEGALYPQQSQAM